MTRARPGGRLDHDHDDLDQGGAPTAARALPVLADRSGTRPAGPGHRPAARGRLHPDLQIDWLTQHPVTRVLEDAGERVHPASAWLASESAHIEAESGRARPPRLPGDPGDGRDPGQQLHGLQRRRGGDAVRPGDRRRVVGRRLLPAREPRAEALLLRVADRLRRLAADARPRRARGPADRRLQRRDAGAASPVSAGSATGRSSWATPRTWSTSRSVRACPNIREWTVAHYDFAGYVTGFEPPTAEEVARSRRELGYGADDVLCIVAVGGSGVG